MIIRESLKFLTHSGIQLLMYSFFSTYVSFSLSRSGGNRRASIAQGYPPELRSTLQQGFDKLTLSAQTRAIALTKGQEASTSALTSTYFFPGNASTTFPSLPFMVSAI